MRLAETLKNFYRRLCILAVFGLFGGGALFYGLPCFLFIALRVRDGRERVLRLRAAVRSGLRFLVRVCVFLDVIRCAFLDPGYGRIAEEELGRAAAAEDAAPGGRVIVANHPSLIDYILLISYLGTGTCVLVKHNLTRTFMRFVIRRLGYRSNESSLEEIEEVLANGDDLLIFPEGSRTRGGAIAFKRGAANVACRMNLPVVPVFIYCSVPGYLSRGFLDAAPPARVPRFYVMAGEPVPPDAGPDDAGRPAAVRARRLNARLEELYAGKIAALRDFAAEEDRGED